MAESQHLETQLPLADAGSRLRAAREAAGLSRADIAARTRIPERHIASIEAGNFDALAGRSYATGFSRTYARAVGLDEQEIVLLVRREIGSGDPDDRRNATTFEPGDPSRVPGRRTAWIAALGAFAVILAGFVLWRSYYHPAAELPPLVAEPVAVDVPAAPAVQPIAVQPAVEAVVEPAEQLVVPAASPTRQGVPRRQSAPAPKAQQPRQIVAEDPPADFGVHAEAGQSSSASRTPSASQTPSVSQTSTVPQ